jgi:hypothetical protein
MDNPTTLLVAIMFVTILAIAIGNVLMVCAEIAGGLRQPAPGSIQLNWIVLTLFMLLNLFWEAKVLLNVTEWLFAEFLYVIAGPMLLLFASSVITSLGYGEVDNENVSDFFELSTRFFTMLALHQIWLLGIDFWFDSFSVLTVISALLLVLFMSLAITKNIALHKLGATLTWVSYIAVLVFQR